MPRKAAIQAIFGSHPTWARKRPFFCPPVAMTVRTRPMIAIPFAINLGSVAMISRRTGIVSCNQRAHDPPMIAIPRADDCRSLHLPEESATADVPAESMVKKRVAWASTFIASLELAKQGDVTLAQADGFTAIHVSPTSVEPA
jgi:hypothetical protein